MMVLFLLEMGENCPKAQQNTLLREIKMIPSFLLLSCELSASAKENPDRKKRCDCPAINFKTHLEVLRA